MIAFAVAVSCFMFCVVLHIAPYLSQRTGRQSKAALHIVLFSFSYKMNTFRSVIRTEGQLLLGPLMIYILVWSQTGLAKNQSLFQS